MPELFTHVKNISQQITSTPFHTYKTSSHYILFPTDTSYKIYDCRKLNVIFHGPLIDKIRCIISFGEHVIIGTNNEIHLIMRSQILDTQSVMNNYDNSNCVEQIIVFGDFVLVRCSQNILIYTIKDDKFLLYDTIEKNVNFIFHPTTYVNKIVILSDNLEIYNIVKKKTVFKKEYKDLLEEENNKINFMVQSKILDVVAMSTNTEIILYNLKTDTILFKIKIPNIRSMSFRTDDTPYLIALNDQLTLINLEEQRIVKTFFKNNEVLNAEFLYGENCLAITTKNSLSLYTMNNYDLSLLKNRIYCNNIEKFKFVDDENILVLDDCEIHNLHVNRDELNFAYSIKHKTYSKNNGNDRNKACDQTEITVAGNKIGVLTPSDLHLLKFDKKNGVSILNSKKRQFQNGCISHCGNFGVIVANGVIFVINLESKLVYKKIALFNDDEKNADHKNYSDDVNENIYNKCIKIEMNIIKDMIVVVYENEIHKYDMKYNKTVLLSNLNITNCLFINNFIVFDSKNEIHFYDLDSNIISRKFPIIISQIKDKNMCAFTVSSDMKYIAISSDLVYIYDIVSGGLIEKMNIKYEKMEFSPDFNYLCFLDGKNIKMYFNNSIFDEYILLERKQKNKHQIKIEEEQPVIYNRDVKDENDFIFNIEAFKEHLVSSFDIIQEDLNNFLNEYLVLYKNNKNVRDAINDFFDVFEMVWIVKECEMENVEAYGRFLEREMII